MAEAQTADAEVDTSMIQEMVLGNDERAGDGDRICQLHLPALRDFPRRTCSGDLKANYIDTGKIKFVYREVYFDRFGLWAAMVARCGDGTKYFRHLGHDL